MKVQVTTYNTDGSINSTTEFKALTYQFPKRGNAADDFYLVVDGANRYGNLQEVATTGGGKYPAYTYFKYNGTSYYLPKSAGALAKGSKLDIIVEAPKPAPAPALASIEDRGPEGLADLLPKVEAADGTEAPAPVAKKPRAPKK